MKIAIVLFVMMMAISASAFYAGTVYMEGKAIDAQVAHYQMDTHGNVTFHWNSPNQQIAGR